MDYRITVGLFLRFISSPKPTENIPRCVCDYENRKNHAGTGTEPEDSGGDLTSYTTFSSGKDKKQK